ncbi:SdrD B-like domain-containing protein, partial [Paralimibaculum aggregatum]|uniref:SdrD B-like domain-containing protein n=1 Tax=Paralimibaculum aggregatum TaxID=3036245 RepID=UPI0025574417
DAGLVEILPGTVSGRYFCDKNGNSLDDDEPGVAGREVRLLSAGDDGSFGTADDVVEASTQTDDTGGYLFADVAPGDYAVMIDGVRLVTRDVDGNVSDDIDSDVDAGGMSDAFSVAAGEDVIDIDAGTACYEVAADALIGVSGLISAAAGARLDAIDNQGVTTYDAGTGVFT